jgi:hypothetical protein
MTARCVLDRSFDEPPLEISGDADRPNMRFYKADLDDVFCAADPSSHRCGGMNVTSLGLDQGHLSRPVLTGTSSPATTKFEM